MHDWQTDCDSVFEQMYDHVVINLTWREYMGSCVRYPYPVVTRHTSMCKGVTDPVAAMLGQSQSLDLGALLGHCGATSYGVSDCKGGSQGSLGLDIRHGPSSVILHRAASHTRQVPCLVDRGGKVGIAKLPS